MKAALRILLLATGLSAPGSLAGQVAVTEDVQPALAARGAAPELIARIQQEVTQASQQGLPTQALLDKALEGLAKGAVPDRIVAAVSSLRNALSLAQGVAVEAGLAEPPSDVVTQAAHALVRGMAPESVRDLIRASGRPEAAATGLMVASSLTAQGIDRSAAAQAVERAYRDGRSPTEVLELPSLAALMIARGMTVSDVTRRMLAGQPLAVDADVQGARPPITVAPPQRGEGTTGSGTTGSTGNTGTGKKP